MEFISLASVAVLGVTFKENCPDIRNSKVFDMIDEFEEWGLSVVAMDPLADPSEVAREYEVSLVKKIEKMTVDALVVAVGHAAFRSMKPAELMDMCRNQEKAVVADLKSIYERSTFIEKGFEVFRL